MPRRRMLRDMLMNYRIMGDGRSRGRERMMSREDYNYGPRYDDAKYTGYREPESEYMSMRNKSFDRGSRYPFTVSGEFGRYDGHYPYYDYPMMDYRGREDYGDYGEGLTRDELEHWKRKLIQEVDEKDKQFFTTEMISQKARQMGAEMKHYNEEELVIATLMAYTDYCKAIKPYIGTNMDIYVALGKAWLEDDDVAVKGSEKLAIYYDCIVEDM